MRQFTMYNLQCTIAALFLLFSLSVFGQSNLTYELKVGTTGENTVLTEFPESYQGEKVNVRIETASLTDRFADRIQTASLTEFDFVFTNGEAVTGFAEVYQYDDPNGVHWTVWQNNKEIKNRAQRTLVQNAYKTFENYLHETVDVRHNRGWIWWLFAGLLLVGTAIYGCYLYIERRKEKNLSAVEQEILRRKRLGMRRHYTSQLYLWLLLLVLYAPIALIAVFSFTKSKVLGNWTGFSMELYANLFTGKADAGLNSAMWYTLVIALVAAVCSTILGTLAAIGIYNMRAKSRKAVSFLNSVPMINPDIGIGHESGFGNRLHRSCGVLYAVRGVKRAAEVEQNEPEHVRGGFGLRRYAGSSLAHGDVTRVMAGHAERIHLGVDAECGRFRSDVLYQRKRRIRDAEYVHLF